MKNKIFAFLKSPSLALFLFIAAMLCVLWAYGAQKKSSELGGDTNSVVTRAEIKENLAFTAATTKAVTSSATKTSTTTTTTAVETTTTTTSAVVTTAETTAAPPADVPVEAPPADIPQETESTAPTPSPGQPLSPYLYAGVSPNSAFYQERLAIAGDSIASGYCLYGYIPNGHNIARESVGLWNLNRFTFNFGYGEMGMVDAVAYMQPKLVMISLGMNDMPAQNPASFAGAYADLVRNILAVAPQTNIVCAGITPVGSFVTYTSNENIRNHNAAIENMVRELNSPQVYYFDAYSVLADSSTYALSSAYSGGDGIHISSGSYRDMLTALFNFLDTTPVMENIQKAEQQ